MQSDAAGYYFLPLLSAGTYTIRATADGYQSQQLQQLELPVAGRIQIDFKLRPLNDVWEAGQYRSVFLPGSKTIVTFYGPDVDTSRSGLRRRSRANAARWIRRCPMSSIRSRSAICRCNGRDVYTMLVSLPGVTANNGTCARPGHQRGGAAAASTITCWMAWRTTIIW